MWFWDPRCSWWKNLFLSWFDVFYCAMSIQKMTPKFKTTVCGFNLTSCCYEIILGCFKITLRCFKATHVMQKKGSTICTLSGTLLIQMYTYFFFVFCLLSELLSTDFTYPRVPGIMGDQFFSEWRFFWRLFYNVQIGTLQFVSWIQICIQTCPNLRKIVCIKIVCIAYVLVLVQIDIY